MSICTCKVFTSPLHTANPWKDMAGPTSRVRLQANNNNEPPNIANQWTREEGRGKR